MVHVCAACTLVTESMSTRQTHVLVACTLALKHSHGSVHPSLAGRSFEALGGSVHANHKISGMRGCVDAFVHACHC